MLSFLNNGCSITDFLSCRCFFAWSNDCLFGLFAADTLDRPKHRAVAAAPVRRFVVTDHMRHCPSVFVVDEVKGNGLCKRELRHLCLIKHAAARVFKPVTELGRADVGQK